MATGNRSDVASFAPSAELRIFWGDDCLDAQLCQGPKGSWPTSRIGRVDEAAPGWVTCDKGAFEVALPLGAQGVFYDGQGGKQALADMLVAGAAADRKGLGKVAVPVGGRVSWVLREASSAKTGEYRAPAFAGAALVLEVAVGEGAAQPGRAPLAGLLRPFLWTMAVLLFVLLGLGALHITRPIVLSDDEIPTEQLVLLSDLIRDLDGERGELLDDEPPSLDNPPGPGPLGRGVARLTPAPPKPRNTPEELMVLHEMAPWLTEVYCFPQGSVLLGEAWRQTRDGLALDLGCLPWFRGLYVGEEADVLGRPQGISQDEWLRRIVLYSVAHPRSSASVKLSRQPERSPYPMAALDSVVRRRLWALVPCALIADRAKDGKSELSFDIEVAWAGRPALRKIQTRGAALGALTDCMTPAIQDVLLPLPRGPALPTAKYKVTVNGP